MPKVILTAQVENAAKWERDSKPTAMFSAPTDCFNSARRTDPHHPERCFPVTHSTVTISPGSSGSSSPAIRAPELEISTVWAN
jgi:hypothetical protein